MGLKVQSLSNIDGFIQLEGRGGARLQSTVLQRSVIEIRRGHLLNGYCLATRSLFLAVAKIVTSLFSMVFLARFSSEDVRERSLQSLQEAIRWGFFSVKILVDGGRSYEKAVEEAKERKKREWRSSLQELYIMFKASLESIQSERLLPLGEEIACEFGLKSRLDRLRLRQLALFREEKIKVEEELLSLDPFTLSGQRYDALLLQLQSMRKKGEEKMQTAPFWPHHIAYKRYRRMIKYSNLYEEDYEKRIQIVENQYSIDSTFNLRSFRLKAREQKERFRRERMKLLKVAEERLRSMSEEINSIHARNEAGGLRSCMRTFFMMERTRVYLEEELYPRFCLLYQRQCYHYQKEELASLGMTLFSRLKKTIDQVYRGYSIWS